ncbi:MAG: hypothetical protein CSYNP_00391 [Syntrophus sp. SKADARSKE-3]|nr:hypothetical protein [Syntrophus sp. SKADARSKE-3]
MCDELNIDSLISIFILACIVCLLAGPQNAGADEEDLFNITNNVKPNVLLVLDNSNSMDKDFQGNSISSWAAGSRSVEGRKALISIVNTYADRMRIGLMSYKLAASSKYYLHNAPYFVSYDPKSYCPDPPAACDTYCRTSDATAQAACQSGCGGQNTAFDATYRDEIITNYIAGSEQRTRYCNLIYPKKNRMANPVDVSRYIYYKIPGAFYNGGNTGTRFCYAADYSNNDNVYNNYSCFGSKTGTNDDSGNYSSYSFGSTFNPTDEDTAQGFNNLGRRLYWYAAGQTWLAGNSPGGGYLHVTVDDNNTGSDDQKTALLTKLATKENDEPGYMSCNSTGNPNTCAYVINAGLTPAAGTFRSAANYFKGERDYQSNANYTSPILDWCQQNFVVYVTDGLPSVNETGGKDSASNLLPGLLSRIDALRTITKNIGNNTYIFDIKTYVLGMALTAESRPALNSMAIHGGTDINGEAYFADDAAGLVSNLGTMFSTIIERAHSFSSASVSSSRTVDENYLYEASLQPSGNDPFWKGSLKKYNINTTDGAIGAPVWDAGEVLKNTTASARHIYTYSASGITRFSTETFSAPFCSGYCVATAVTADQLGVVDGKARDNIVGYFRGEATYNPDNWKLGDIFHSNPVTIGTPSPYFYDHVDAGSTNAFKNFREAHERTTANQRRIVIAGANDGQFHAFKTADGAEFWSFIPPNLLSKLKYASHTADTPAARSGKTHQYFVDGPVVAADIWLGSGSGTTKHDTEWRTLVVFSVGRNDRDYTTGTPAASATKYWSSVTSCDAGLSDTFSTATPYYCGYWAFDFTNVTDNFPAFKWRMHANATQAPYLGEPWSKMAIGRVKVNGNEKWVGFIGGGYNAGECTGNTCPDTGKPGKGFFVIDLSTGGIIWSYTNRDDADMEYSIPAAPIAVDTDMDGFVDKVFVGDMGGNMWQFKFCDASSPSTCSYDNWKGRLLLTKVGGEAQSRKQPIYGAATVSRDISGKLWVYWGTGDKVDPTGSTLAGCFWAVKVDQCSSAPCSRTAFDNLSSNGSTYTETATKNGYYINLTGQSEKILGEPIVFGGNIYFTTYTPGAGTGCNVAGDAKLYVINAATGAGAANSAGDRSMSIGSGIASPPVISLKPGNSMPPDLYITVGGATTRVNLDPATISTRTNMLFWRDRRIQ